MTASVSLSAIATPVILLPPALMPADVMLVLLPVKERPVLVTFVLPTDSPDVVSVASPMVMLPALPRLMLLFSLTVNVPALASVVILESPFTANVPSNLIAPLVVSVLSAVKVMPFVVIASAFVFTCSSSNIKFCEIFLSADFLI